MKALPHATAALLALLATLPAAASAADPVGARLHRADVALTRAQDGADAGDDAKVVRNLHAADRQTRLALTAALRLVVRDRDGADGALADVLSQVAANGQTGMDLLDGASPAVTAAAGDLLTASTGARGRVLTTLHGLDTEDAWGDALVAMADDAAAEVTAAADEYDGSGPAGAAVLTALVARDTQAAAAIVAEVDAVAGNADLDPGGVDTLAGDLADAADALDGASGVPASDGALIGRAASALAALGDDVATLADTLGASSADDGSWADDEGAWEDDATSGDGSGWE